MSKQQWCDAFNQRYDECIANDLSDSQAFIEAYMYADDAAERTEEQKEMKRKEMRGG